MKPTTVVHYMIHYHLPIRKHSPQNLSQKEIEEIQSNEPDKIKGLIALVCLGAKLTEMADFFPEIHNRQRFDQIILEMGYEGYWEYGKAKREKLEKKQKTNIPSYERDRFREIIRHLFNHMTQQIQSTPYGNGNIEKSRWMAKRVLEYSKSISVHDQNNLSQDDLLLFLDVYYLAWKNRSPLRGEDLGKIMNWSKTNSYRIMQRAGLQPLTHKLGSYPNTRNLKFIPSRN